MYPKGGNIMSRDKSENKWKLQETAREVQRWEITADNKLTVERVRVAQTVPKIKPNMDLLNKQEYKDNQSL